MISHDDDVSGGGVYDDAMVIKTPVTKSTVVLLWSPYVIGQTIIFLPCDFYLLSSSFFPRLISAVGDWMSTILLHMAWP